MKVLLTGANGFVGKALGRRLLACGWQVKGAVRNANAAGELPAGVEPVVVGNIDGNTDWYHALQDVDRVIHLAARVHVMHEERPDPLAEFRRVNLDGTVKLATSAAQAGVKRLVYVSSIKVNGEATSGRAFSEMDAAAPQDPYGVSKWEAEQALWEISRQTPMEAVVVRPPLVYGPGVGGNFALLLKAVEKGIPLPFANVKNSRSLIYVENLADALIACAKHPDAAGETFLLSDGYDLSTPELLRELAGLLGKKSRLFPCPVSLLQLAGVLSGKSAQIERLLGSLQVDSSKIRRCLGWSPPYSAHQGLQQTLSR